MIVVSDTSPLSALIRLDLVDILPKLFGEIIIPPAVKTELSYLSQQGIDLAGFWNSSWLNIQVPGNQTLIHELSLELDIGEVEAIVLAQELEPRFLLIDEKRGRDIAENLGIPIVGLLGVLLLAKRAGILEEIRPIIIDLKGIGFFVSLKITNIVLTRAGEAEL